MLEDFMKTLSHILLILFFLLTSISSAQVNARMLQFPDVSATHITFTYGGDVWIVAKEGGTAYKLNLCKRN